jgi:hypothetical protein
MPATLTLPKLHLLSSLTGMPQQTEAMSDRGTRYSRNQRLCCTCARGRDLSRRIIVMCSPRGIFAASATIKPILSNRTVEWAP